jgi:hypothetical protein
VKSAEPGCRLRPCAFVRKRQPKRWNEESRVFTDDDRDSQPETEALIQQRLPLSLASCFFSPIFPRTTRFSGSRLRASRRARRLSATNSYAPVTAVARCRLTVDLGNDQLPPNR